MRASVPPAVAGGWSLDISPKGMRHTGQRCRPRLRWICDKHRRQPQRGWVVPSNRQSATTLSGLASMCRFLPRVADYGNPGLYYRSASRILTGVLEVVFQLRETESKHGNRVL